MSFFSDELKKNRPLHTVSVIMIIFIVIEGLQLLNYPLIITGMVPDYNRIIMNKLLPGLTVFDPAILLPFVIINLLLRISAFINILKINGQGKYFGIISSIYTILLVVFMLPVNIIWEPAVMCFIIILILKGYKK